jgi:hypothetical protein
MTQAAPSMAASEEGAHVLAIHDLLDTTIDFFYN